MASKPTKRDMFTEIQHVLEGADYGDLAAMVAHEIELIDKRKSAPRKPTADQLANEVLKDHIVEELAVHPDGMTATEVANAEGKTVQKVSQLLKQLGAEGRVTRVDAHGKEKARFYSV